MAQPHASPDAVVVGAGVIGLTTAVALAEAGVRVRVDASLMPHETTSDVAGALWDPHLAKPYETVGRWSVDSYHKLTRLALTEPSAGVRIISGSGQSKEPCDPPGWLHLVGGRLCMPEELREGYVTGWRYTAPIIHMPTHLDYLVERLTAAGGHIRRHAYSSLDEALQEAPLVVNCSGTGARQLTPDPRVQAVRGQVVIVRNPGIDEFFLDDTPGVIDHTYLFPHTGTLVLGGSEGWGVWDRDPDPDTTRAIIERCAEVEPAVLDSEILAVRVGLRPVRDEVCVGAQPGLEDRVLNNYGHGGAGPTLAWACADVIQRQALQRVHELRAQQARQQDLASDRGTAGTMYAKNQRMDSPGTGEPRKNRPASAPEMPGANEPQPNDTGATAPPAGERGPGGMHSMYRKNKSTDTPGPGADAPQRNDSAATLPPVPGRPRGVQRDLRGPGDGLSR